MQIIDRLIDIEQFITPTTLVVFDIDEVLIVTKDHYHHPHGESFFFEYTERLIARTPSYHLESIHKRLSLSLTLPQRILIEETTPNFIAGLQARGNQVIALTAWPTGSFGHIDQLERVRIDQLTAHNIIFSTEFKIPDRHIFEHLQHQVRSVTHGQPIPLYEAGMLFSPGLSKGVLLREFLAHVDLRPEHVVFVDDRADHVRSVETELASAGISCDGFQYHGAQRHFRPLNKALLQHQFDHLVEHGIWLDDATVLARLEL